MIAISVEIAEWQPKRFIEERTRFFKRERANASASADRVQERTNQSAKAAALAAERAAHCQRMARVHLGLAKQARAKAARLASFAGQKPPE